jgi:hypothetical protein
MDADPHPQTDPAWAAMSTLRISKAGRKMLGLGGTGHWVVVDAEGAQVATATNRLAAHELRIESGRDRLTARIPAGMLQLRYPEELEVVHDGTGQSFMEGRLASVDLRGGTFHEEAWAITLSSGAAITWAYTMIGDRKLGFYEPSGRALMTFGHDPSFDVSGDMSTLRILLRFWGAAAASADRYLVRADSASLGRIVPAEEVPVLAMLGVWLERTSGGRYASQTSGTSMD